jgi:hypothetical protein
VLGLVIVLEMAQVGLSVMELVIVLEMVQVGLSVLEMDYQCSRPHRRST